MNIHKEKNISVSSKFLEKCFKEVHTGKGKICEQEIQNINL